MRAGVFLHSEHLGTGQRWMDDRDDDDLTTFAQ